jgi:transposase
LWRIDVAIPPFVRGKEQLTKQLKNYVNDLSRFTTMQSVAELAGLGWDTVKWIVKERLTKDYSHRRLKDVKRLSIDEIYIGRKRKFLTLVIDYDTGRIIWVANGRDSHCLRDFFKRLKRSKAKVEAVSMDMSKAFANAVRNNLPNATIVFDHFHVVKKMNEHIDDLRRDIARKANENGQGSILKGARWLLLHNRSNLREDQKQVLDELLKLNQPLACAYLLKEEMAQLWKQANEQEALDFLNAWCEKATASDIPQMKKMVKTLVSHQDGILAYFKTRMTNGKMEGINRKIRTMLSQVYGLRDEDFLKLKLFALHEATHQFVG